MSPHALAALVDSRRHALLVAHRPELRRDQIDDVVDLFDQFMGELMRKGERAQEQHVLQHAKTMNAYLWRFADGLEAFLQALANDRDPSLALLQELPLAELEPALAAIRALARPADFDYLDLVETRYGPARSALLAFYRTLTFEPMIVRDPALRALDHVMTLYARNQRVTAIEQTVGTTTYIAPLEHLTNRWRTHVVQGSTIQSTLYEVSAFDRLKAELRSGDVAVNQSRRYGSFESSLIPRDRWDHLKATGQIRLAITGDAQSYLERRDQEIHERFTTLHQQLGTDAGAVSVDQQENLHLTRPEPSTPPEVKALRRRLGRMLPVVDLPDLLAEVQGWVPFLDRATHARTGAPLESNLHAPVLAALVAHGTNIGLHAMERASRFSYEQLASATDWYLHDESLKWMLIDLDHFLLHHPMSALWGDGTRSSSDGLRMRVAVQAANADPNTRYGDVTRGLTMYWPIADVGPPFGRQVFGVNEREYLHVLDAIYHHETELDIQEHSTDTAGGTDHLFALSPMLGLRFYPRLADILGRQYFTLRPPGDYGPLNQLIKGRIDPRPVVATWDDRPRVAASIPHGITSATVLMRQLQN